MGKMQFNLPKLTKDSQVVNETILVLLVTGQFIIGDTNNAMHFAHTFTLVATAPGQYYVHNEIFKLCLDY